MTLRDRWPSRTAFIYAAIGSAVGFGNLLRHPYLAHKFGGGAFLIPYLIALFVIGIPLLILEFALGQKMQKGAVDSLAAIKKKFSGLAWWGLFTAFIVASYYVVMMGWALIYLFRSFGIQWSANPQKYFYSNVLQLSGIGSIGTIVPAIFIALIIGWIFIYFSVWKGVKSISKIVRVTVPLLVILLLVLFFRVITLDGAMTGIIAYITPNFDALFDQEVWLVAVGQIFFSLRLAFGVMIAYSSYNKKDSDINKNAFTVGITNTLISIFAGFIVFGTLGFMAEQQGIAFENVVAEGSRLAFVAFPKALSLMPFAAFFSVLFFLTLLTLAISTALSLIQAVDTTIADKIKMKKQKIALIVCVLCFLAGIIYITNSGLYFLDLIDHYIVYSLLVIGILECIAVGWIFGARKMRSYINKVSDFKIGAWWDIAIRYVIPVSLTMIVVSLLKAEFAVNYNGYPDWAIMVGWLFVLIPLAIAFLIPQRALKIRK